MVLEEKPGNTPVHSVSEFSGSSTREERKLVFIIEGSAK